MKKNAISWFEIPVLNMERAKKFYETLLDVELSTLKIGETHEMALFPDAQDQETVSGGLMCGQGYTPSSEGALVYLNANPDLQNSSNRVAEAGGTVLMDKRQISEEAGFMAVIEDTEGNRIALHSAN